jgi:hypothetical protein
MPELLGPPESKDLKRTMDRAAGSARQAVIAAGDDLLPGLYDVREVYSAHHFEVFNVLEDATARGVREAYRMAGLDPSLNLVDPSQIRWAAEQSSKLVADIAFEQRRVLLAVQRHARIQRYTEAQTRQALRDAAGLNVRQATSLLRYRDQLIRAGANATQVERLARGYAMRQRAYRSALIADTETQIALNVGQEQLWRVARREGYLKQNVKRVWLTSGNERVCPICRPMHGQTVGLDEPFITPTGAAVYTPGMTHPKCQCGQMLQEERRYAA